MGTHLNGSRRAFLRVSLPVLAATAVFVALVLPSDAQALAPTLLSITVSPTSQNVPLGDTQQFVATGHYSDGSTQNLSSSATWSTSASDVATVSTSGLATSVGTGLATITATDPSDSLIFGSGAMTVVPAELVSISVSPSTANIPLGETAPFAAKGTYTDGTTQSLTDSVTWSTSASDVATVDSTGKVTSVGTGLATITATDPSDTAIFGTAAVTVLPAELVAISVSPPASNLPLGDTVGMTATGQYTDGSTQNITDSVTWSTSASDVATVSGTGTVDSVGTGGATITATDPSDTAIFGTAAVTVLPAELVSISVTPPLVNLPLGETEQLTATGTYTDGSTQDLTKTVDWSSSASSDVTVSSKGLVTAVGSGAADVTATDPSDTAIFGSTVVTVLPAVLVSITVTPPASDVPAGDTEPLSATGVYSDGSTENLTDSVTWSSSETQYGTVSSTGVVTGVADGATTITATDPADTAIFGTAAVTVLPAVLVSITVTPPASDVPAGDTEPLSATGVYSDGSTENLTDSVTWSSSETQYAQVSDTGVVSGIADGASTITATDPSDTAIFGTAAVTVLPAVLVTVTVSPLTASVAEYGTQQFQATGVYSDGSTENLTDTVTWSSSDYGEANVSNAAGSNGVATGVSVGAVTITATDPSSGLFGVATLDITGPSITISPSSGGPKTRVKIKGEGFTPGGTFKVVYKTGVATEPGYRLCLVHVSAEGTFTCKAHIGKKKVDGTDGPHQIVAKMPKSHAKTATTVFTLTTVSTP